MHRFGDYQRTIHTKKEPKAAGLEALCWANWLSLSLSAFKINRKFISFIEWCKYYRNHLQKKLRDINTRNGDVCRLTTANRKTISPVKNRAASINIIFPYIIYSSNVLLYTYHYIRDRQRCSLSQHICSHIICPQSSDCVACNAYIVDASCLCVKQ